MIFDRGLDKKIKSYQKSFQKYGVDSKALKWASKKATEIRYKEIVADFDFKNHKFRKRDCFAFARNDNKREICKNKKILDVGCGFADILPYILKKGKDFKYTGVDIVPEFIGVSKKRYPKHRFIVRDYFADPLKRRYDIIISSGALNSNVKRALVSKKRAIKTMFDHTDFALAFNMAGGYPQPRNKKKYKVYYVNSLDILKFCLTLTKKVIFRHHYRKKDFTIVMFK